MLLNLLYLATSILGLVVVLIALLYRNNRYVNTYLTLYFFLGSLRFLIHALTNLLAIERIPIADFAFTTLAWPLLFLYFKDLINNNSNHNIKSELKHLIVPFFLFTLVCFKSQIKEEMTTILLKIGVPIVITYTLGYCLWSFILLKKHLWTKRSLIKSTNKQQLAIRNWSKFLFFIFTLILIRFITNPIIYPQNNFLNPNNDFLYLGAMMWIVVYIKLLTSPEFLFGYDVFQDKINKHKIDFIVFDNQWNKSISIDITNKKDLVLKEIIDKKYIEYIEIIEHIAQKTDFFFSTRNKSERFGKQNENTKKPCCFPV